MIIRWTACSQACATEYMEQWPPDPTTEFDVTIRPFGNVNITHSVKCLQIQSRLRVADVGTFEEDRDARVEFRRRFGMKVPKDFFVRKVSLTDP